MKYAFAKNGTGIFSKLICLWTWSKYYHVEAIFSDGTTFGALPKGDMRTNYEKNKKYDPYYWDLIEVPHTKEEEDVLRKWCDSEVGCKYDWNGILFSQVLGLRREHPNKWFCSELCTAMEKKLGNFLNVTPCTVSPKKFYYLLNSIILKK
jgi:uncharacterized protein YycO